MFYVYAYYRPDEPAPFYIGKGSKSRVTDHLRDSNLKKRTLFYRELRRLLRAGIPPKIVIIKKFDKESDAFALECELIKKYGRMDIGTGCLCNHTDGGEGLVGIIGSMTGSSHSYDTRVKMSEAARGRQFSLKTKEKMRQAKSWKMTPVESYNLSTGQAIKVYPSAIAAEVDGYQNPNIHRVCKGKGRSHGGVGWRYC